ncbi:unnamed protein product [Cochlearia groenlandica]
MVTATETETPQRVGQDVFNDIMNTSQVGVILKLANTSFIWDAETVHTILTQQLAIGRCNNENFSHKLKALNACTKRSLSSSSTRSLMIVHGLTFLIIYKYDGSSSYPLSDLPFVSRRAIFNVRSTFQFSLSSSSSKSLCVPCSSSSEFAPFVSSQ